MLQESSAELNKYTILSLLLKYLSNFFLHDIVMSSLFSHSKQVTHLSKINMPQKQTFTGALKNSCSENFNCLWDVFIDNKYPREVEARNINIKTIFLLERSKLSECLYTSFQAITVCNFKEN